MQNFQNKRFGTSSPKDQFVPIRQETEDIEGFGIGGTGGGDAVYRFDDGFSPC
jgi:hypothetical protein